MMEFDEWFFRAEAEAQALVGQARGTDEEVQLRIGVYLMAFISLAKVEGIPLAEQTELLQRLHPRIVAIDARKAANA